MHAADMFVLVLSQCVLQLHVFNSCAQAGWAALPVAIAPCYAASFGQCFFKFVNLTPLIDLLEAHTIQLMLELGIDGLGVCVCLCLCLCLPAMRCAFG